MMTGRNDEASTFGASADTDVRLLRPENVASLRLQNHPRITPERAEEIVKLNPDTSFFIPETGEFILVTPWRHRAELMSVHLLSGFTHETALVEAAMHRAKELGSEGFVMVDLSESRPATFYERHGLAQLDEIVTYNHPRPTSVYAQSGPPKQQFRQVPVSEPHILEAVQELDNAAFPWLWRNSSEEFLAYLTMPNVEVWYGIADGQIQSYVGLTHYYRWGHLDRIATHPDTQRRGYGTDSLRFAMHRMVSYGARSVALSTQVGNEQSRSIYERVGFERTPKHDYSIYGKLFETENTEID